jgi:UDP-N-acetylmuramate dehydrogenase
MYNGIMQIQTDISLKNYSTMRLGGIAKALTIVTSKQDLLDAVAWAKKRHLPLLILGGGSNVIFSNGYPGLVIVNRIIGFDVITEDAAGVTIRIGAGEPWDLAVAKSVKMNLHGIEFLSAIPGTSGATPVQNVGAYGAEIADTFVELEAYDLGTEEFVTLSKQDCGFSYRNSIFKPPEDRKYIITSITLRLTKATPKPPFYESLQKYLDAHNVTTYTPQVIRQAVIAIRTKKLPDPAKVPNTGSFFKNPVVTAQQAAELTKKYPDIPHWPLNTGEVKLAAGWLIEQAGLKNYHAHGMKTYEHHALVLVNESAKTYKDLLDFENEIIAKIKDVFGVTLQQEPELL